MDGKGIGDETEKGQPGFLGMKGFGAAPSGIGRFGGAVFHGVALRFRISARWAFPDSPKKRRWLRMLKKRWEDNSL